MDIQTPANYQYVEKKTGNKAQYQHALGSSFFSLLVLVVKSFFFREVGSHENRAIEEKETFFWPSCNY
jgi:hypothetical protein